MCFIYIFIFSRYSTPDPPVRSPVFGPFHWRFHPFLLWYSSLYFKSTHRVRHFPELLLSITYHKLVSTLTGPPSLNHILRLDHVGTSRNPVDPLRQRRRRRRPGLRQVVLPFYLSLRLVGPWRGRRVGRVSLLHRWTSSPTCTGVGVYSVRLPPQGRTRRDTVHSVSPVSAVRTRGRHGRDSRERLVPSPT